MISSAPRRRLGALAASVCGLAFLSLPVAATAQDEPVELSVSATPVVAAHAPIKVSVAVNAEPGALDIAAMPLHLRVALEPECGGSFAGTYGSIAIDDEIPAPAAGAAYTFSARGHTRIRQYGRETVCAFLEDSEERQFATSTEEIVNVSRPCTLATRRLAKLSRRAKHAAPEKRRALRRQVRSARHHKRVACLGQLGHAGASSSASGAIPKIKHVFILMLENEDSDESFGPSPPSPYLGKTLPAAGALLPNYYGIGHHSLDNYLALISGQPPNAVTQADCTTYSEMTPGLLNDEGVAIGQGCVYPSTVETVANQLEAAGHTWHGFMEDMALGQPTTCRHPTIGSPDNAFAATPGDQYATRHDPFVYFHSIIDTPACSANVVDLNELPAALANESKTPEYSFITPDLCADGHDATCADGTSPAGYAGIESFLKEWAPRIEGSAAFQDSGMLLVTFDESENGSEGCCGETNGPNTPSNGGTVAVGPGGGKVGAVMLSPCIQPGTVSDTAYNHYSTLRWVESNFGLTHLAEAAPSAVGSFGPDVFTRPDCDRGATLGVSPRSASAGAKTSFKFRLRSGLSHCTQGSTIVFAGHRAVTNKKGIARLKVRLHGKRATARATSAICKPAKATVRVRPSG